MLRSLTDSTYASSVQKIGLFRLTISKNNHPLTRQHPLSPSLGHTWHNVAGRHSHVINKENDFSAQFFVMIAQHTGLKKYNLA